jgi:2'-5' RNA ligase
VFSLSILLPPSIEDALSRWSEQTPGATLDPQASHVTLLNFESGQDEERLLQRVRAACRGISSFRLVLDQAVHEPYLGKPGLDIVMLVPSAHSPGRDAVLALRERLRAALSDVIDADMTVPEDGEFLPHLTMTAGLPAEAATVLCIEAEKLRIAFEVREVSAWSNAGGAWRLLETQPLAVAA